VKTLTLTDRRGNGDSCSLILPAKMTHWKVSALREFLAAGNDRARADGFLAAAPNPLRFEPFRQLVVTPELTYNAPVTFEQNGRILQDDDAIDLALPTNHLALDRAEAATGPDTAQISVRARNMQAFESNRRQIVAIIDHLFDFTAFPIALLDGRRVSSFAQLIDHFIDRLDRANALRFIFRIAMMLHAAPFENFSKIIGGRQFRCGYEMWSILAQGFGGVCGEKTAALKFICDVLSIPTRPVLGSDSPIPGDFEDALHAYIDSEGDQNLPVDIHHHILEITLGAERYVIDVTNGNIPMVFLDADDSDTLVSHGCRARMVYRVERLAMRRASTWVGDALETLSEYHVPELHLQYVFAQGLGLHISSKAYIGVYFDWGGERSALKQNYYSSQARGRRFPYPRFIHADNMHSVPDPALGKLLTQTLDALRLHYADKQYTGDFTFVIQPLTPYFWSMPHISTSVKHLLGSELS